MAGYYTVEFSGVPFLNYESVSFENSMDLNVEQGSLVYPDFKTMVNSNALGADIAIFRDSTCIWRGIGVKYTQSFQNDDGTRDWTLSMASLKKYLDREIFYKGTPPVYAYQYGVSAYELNQSSAPYWSAPSTLISSIFLDILNTQYINSITGKGVPNNLTQGSINGGTSGGSLGSTYPIPHVTMTIVRQNSLQVLQNLINASLWEVRFNPSNLTVDFSKALGSGSLTSPLYTFSEGNTLYDVQDTFGIDTMVNRVAMMGAGSVNTDGEVGPITTRNGDAQISTVVDNTSSQSLYGRYAKPYNFPNIYDVNVLTTYGQALETDLLSPIETIQVQVYDPNTGVAFREGDYIALTSPTYGWNAYGVRIMKIDRSFDANNAEQVTLTCLPTSRLVSYSHTRYKQLEYILNSQTANNAAAFNTMNTSPSPTLSTIPNTIIQQAGITSAGTWHFHMTASICGIYGGCSVAIICLSGTAVVSISSVQIVDRTTNTVLLPTISGSITPGQPYVVNIPSTNDISDHDIDFVSTWSGVSGGVAYVQGEVSFSPTLET